MIVFSAEGKTAIRNEPDCLKQKKMDKIYLKVSTGEVVAVKPTKDNITVARNGDIMEIYIFENCWRKATKVAYGWQLQESKTLKPVKAEVVTKEAYENWVANPIRSYPYAPITYSL